MADPTYGAGIGWVAYPCRGAEGRYRLSIFVRPRLYGPDPGSHPLQPVFQALFADWPKTLSDVVGQNFTLDFCALGAGPIVSSETTFKRPGYPLSSSCWSALFHGSGPSLSSPLVAASSSDLKLAVRPSGLSSELTHKDLASPDWARKVVPVPVHTYNACGLHDAINDLRSARDHELFSGGIGAYGAGAHGLFAVALEDWKLPHREQVLSRASEKRLNEAAIDRLEQTLKATPVSTQSVDIDWPSAAQKALKDLLPHAAKIGPLPDFYTTNESAQFARLTTRLGYSAHAPGSRILNVLQDLLSNRPWSADFPSPLSSGNVAAARLQAEHIFARTERFEEVAERDPKLQDAPWADDDFFTRLSRVEQYRGLLRPLGLVFDLDFDWPEGAPDIGAIRVRPPPALMPGCAIDFRTAYTKDARQFRALSRAELEPSATSFLRNSRVPVGDPQLFSLRNEDQDAAVRRMGITADPPSDARYAEQILPLTNDANIRPSATAAVIDLIANDPVAEPEATFSGLGISSARLLSELQARVDQLDAGFSFPGGTALVRFHSPTSKAGWDPLESTCRHASLSIL